MSSWKKRTLGTIAGLLGIYATVALVALAVAFSAYFWIPAALVSGFLGMIVGEWATGL